jgi:acetylornithine deacetylase
LGAGDLRGNPEAQIVGRCEQTSFDPVRQKLSNSNLIVIEEERGMNFAREKILQRIDQNKNEMFKDLTEIVRIPSVVGKEGKAQEWVIEKMRSVGLKVETFEADKKELSNHPAYIGTEWSYEGRPNVIGKVEGDSKARSLILNGHIDVVSAEPINAWKHDPWGAEISGGKMYGRGTADMKGGLVANLYAVKALIEANALPKGPIFLFSVIEEEAGGGGGTLACLLRGYRATAMLNTEPFLKVAIAHPGILYFRIKVQGKSTHAGRSQLGVNAIGKMIPIYNLLTEIDEDRANRLRFSLAEMDSGRSCNLNIGTFHAGDWPSSVAGWAAMDCRISFVPGETEESVKREITDRIGDGVSKDTWLREHPPEIEWFGWHANPWIQNEKDPFIQLMLKNGKEVLGTVPPVVGKPTGLDTRFCSEFGIAACAFGPNGGEIHGVDEYVELETVLQTAKIAALTALDWCK